MRPLIVIPAGATVSLGDEGTHGMFVNSPARFRVGEMIDAVLVFEMVGRVPVSFKVEKITVLPEEGASHAH